MTCQEAEPLLDLLAADECDAPEREALERHLHDCPACAGSYAQSRQLVGLLALQLDEAAPRRLWRRIEAAAHARRPRRAVLPFVRRVAAVAAMLLLAVAFGFGIRNWPGDEPQLQLAAVGVRAHPGVLDVQEAVPARGPDKQLKTRTNAEPLTLVLPSGQHGEAFRRQLAQAERDGNLPPPTAVPLAFVLKNTGAHPVIVNLGAKTTSLALDVHGPSVFRSRAVGVDQSEIFKMGVVRLAPGQQQTIRFDRLIAGAPGRWEYIYLTEPGEYTIVARLTFTVADRLVTVVSEPLRVRCTSAKP
jgi:hypothetical protein